MGAQFYHVWFSTRRRRWLLLGDVEQAIESLLMKVAEGQEYGSSPWVRWWTTYISCWSWNRKKI